MNDHVISRRDRRQGISTSPSGCQRGSEADSYRMFVVSGLALGLSSGSNYSGDLCRNHGQCMGWTKHDIGSTH